MYEWTGCPGCQPTVGCGEPAGRKNTAASDRRVALVEDDAPEHAVALVGGERCERRPQIDRAALGDQLELLILELDRLHPQTDSAGRLDLAAPYRVQDQVAGDPDQPPDCGPARLVVLGSVL